MMSIGWRFESGVTAIEGLSLAVGVVLSQVLERYGMNARLKWPNDVLLPCGERLGKLAGILIEVSGDAAGPCEVVVGLGINIEFSDGFRAQISQPVAAVRDQQPTVSRNQLAAELLGDLMPLLAGYESHGFPVWQSEWNLRHAFKDCPVEVLRGNECFMATAEGVDETGNLWIRHGERRERLSGGEISVRGRT